MSTAAPALKSRLRRLWIPVPVAVVELIGSFASANGQPARRDPDPLMVVLLMIGPIALYWLRIRPVAVLWATSLSTLVYMLIGYPYGPVLISFVIALFAAAGAGHRLASWLAIIALYGGHALGRVILGINESGIYQVLLVGACFILLGFGAELYRGHRERMAEMARSRREEELRRAGEERLRIAQELHDVVAHHISLINVQASTALHLVDRQPEQASTALAAIKDASKEALVELRSIVGVLRQADESAPRQPVTGLAHLDQLITRTSRAGLEVHAVLHGEHRPLPTGLDRAAFRIIQESLTNVVRHAKATTATIRVQYGEDDLTVQVDDDGTSLTAAPHEGNGIIGMRERATALGGTLTTTLTPAGGLRITARLPL